MAKQKQKRKRKKYTNGKMMKLPEKYNPCFMKDLDKRTEIFQLLHNAHTDVTIDLGGFANLSHIKRALVERFVFLEFTLRSLEQKMVEDSKSEKKSPRLLGKWLMAANCLSGLSKTLGLERRAKQIDCDLQSYVQGKKEKKKKKKKDKK